MVMNECVSRYSTPWRGQIQFNRSKQTRRSPGLSRGAFAHEGQLLVRGTKRETCTFFHCHTGHSNSREQKLFQFCVSISLLTGVTGVQSWIGPSLEGMNRAMFKYKFVCVCVCRERKRACERASYLLIHSPNAWADPSWNRKLGMQSRYPTLGAGAHQLCLSHFYSPTFPLNFISHKPSESPFL